VPAPLMHMYTAEILTAGIGSPPTRCLLCSDMRGDLGGDPGSEVEDDGDEGQVNLAASAGAADLTVPPQRP
jgi:hypothetical protein